MNRFIIVDGLPYLYDDGKAFAVRWDEEGFTVGAEVELASVPDYTYSEISILAKCHDCLNSIDIERPEKEQTSEPKKEPENTVEETDVEKQAETEGQDTVTEAENNQTEQEGPAAEVQEENPEQAEQAETPENQEDPAAEGEKEENTEPPALEEMTVAELKAYAAENSIDLGTATKKADIIAAINAAE